MSEYAIAGYENPSGPRNGKKRVVRGGAFDMEYNNSRITRRDSLEPRVMMHDLGFRIVLQVDNKMIA